MKSALTFGCLLLLLLIALIDFSLSETPPARLRVARKPRAQAVHRNDTSRECDYEDALLGVDERINHLIAVGVDQRNQLLSIEQKQSQLERRNFERLDSLNARLSNFGQSLDNVEQTQYIIKILLEELKHLNEDKTNGAELSRASRQTYANQMALKDEATTDYPPGIFSTYSADTAYQLNSLAAQLATTTKSVQALQQELQRNITKLSHSTSILQRRLLNFLHHQKATPQAPNFYATAHVLPLTTNCLNAAELSQHGIQRLHLTPSSEPFYVRCEEDGWAVVLERFNGDVNFERDWLEYKAGFGNLAGEHFIGLDKLHALTSSAVQELRVLLEDHEGNVAEAGYESFAIAGEKDLYALHLLGKFNNGTAGDSLSYHAGYKFSTYDHDNDGCLECNCALSHKGGWWYNWCATSNLMGNYFESSATAVPNDQGVLWQTFRGLNYSLKKVKMLVRPANQDLADARR